MIVQQNHKLIVLIKQELYENVFLTTSFKTQDLYNGGSIIGGRKKKYDHYGTHLPIFSLAKNVATKAITRKKIENLLKNNEDYRQINSAIYVCDDYDELSYKHAFVAGTKTSLIEKYGYNIDFTSIDYEKSILYFAKRNSLDYDNHSQIMEALTFSKESIPLLNIISPSDIEMFNTNSHTIMEMIFDYNQVLPFKNDMEYYGQCPDHTLSSMQIPHIISFRCATLCFDVERLNMYPDKIINCGDRLFITNSDAMIPAILDYIAPVINPDQAMLMMFKLKEMHVSLK